VCQELQGLRAPRVLQVVQDLVGMPVNLVHQEQWDNRGPQASLDLQELQV